MFKKLFEIKQNSLKSIIFWIKHKKYKLKSREMDQSSQKIKVN